MHTAHNLRMLARGITKRARPQLDLVGVGFRTEAELAEYADEARHGIAWVKGLEGSVPLPPRARGTRGRVILAGQGVSQDPETVQEVNGLPGTFATWRRAGPSSWRFLQFGRPRSS